MDGVGIRTGGAASLLYELVQHLPLARPSWNWHLFMLPRRFRDFDDPPVSAAVTIESVPNAHTASGRLNWLLRASRERIKSVEADVTFSIANIGQLWPGVPGVVLCHQPNAFFEEGLRGASILCRARMRFMRNLILRGARVSEAVIVQTESMRQRLQELEPRLASRLQVIPSGYREPSSALPVRPDLMANVLRSPHPRLIYVSHPSTHKNHDAIIRALPEIRKRAPTATLMLTLDPKNPPNASYATFLQNITAEVKRAQVDSNVVWLGILNSEEIRWVLRASDLMVYPSLAESFGLPLAEAMEAGCPIAAADLPYAHDVAGQAAEYFDPQKPSSIASVVMSLVDNVPRLNEMRSCGRERSQKFSYRTIACEIAQTIERAAVAKNAFVERVTE